MDWTKLKLEDICEVILKNEASMNNLNITVETEDSFSSLLELAAEDDAKNFKKFIDRDPSAIDEIGMWYGRKKGSKQMVLEPRTPLMVAATYGSIEVLELIISTSSCDFNRCVGPEGTTALHCAASGGSAKVVEAVKLLISAGADVSMTDANGQRPADVIVNSPHMIHLKIELEELLGGGKSNPHPLLRVSTSSSASSSLPLSSSSPDEDGDGSGSSPSSDSTSSLISTKEGNFTEKKEYPIDPSLPDIKNSMYASDEFRMFSFKVRPCSRAYSHDWTECPFVHPGENARRRDPRKYHYSCVPCPDFRKGACRRGDLCEYAHGVFECWLHPAQYRTRLCKDGIGCTRRVCFFAHTREELRPLYVSTGSAVPSPRSMEMAAAAAAMSLFPGSRAAMSAVLSPNHVTPPMSPSGLSSHAWPQQSVPTLHLPANNGLQSSRLRSSLSARDMHVDELSMLSDLDAQQLNEFCFSPSHARLASLAANRSVQVRSKSLNPSNLDELFSAEINSSPRNGSDQGGVFSPSQNSAVLGQFQQPINTSSVFNPINVEHQPISGHNPLLHASLGIPSPSRMSPRSIDQHSPLSPRLCAFAQQEKLQHLRSLSSRDLGAAVATTVGSPVSSSWSNWGSPTGKLDWGVNGEELGRFRQSSSKIELGPSSEEPDVSWVQTLVNPLESKEKLSVNTGNCNGSDDGDNNHPNSQTEEHAVIGAWLEQMQLDQLVA